MAKQTEKPIVAGLLLFFFIGLVAVAVQFMQNPPQAPEPPKAEGFASAAPTRATDCSCLPGYVPSNIKVTSTTKLDNSGISGLNIESSNRIVTDYGGKIMIGGGYNFVPDNSDSFFPIVNYETDVNGKLSVCGIPILNTIPINTSLKMGGRNFGCDMLKIKYATPQASKQLYTTEKTYTNLGYFFCQSLSNPGEIKQCY